MQAASSDSGPRVTAPGSDVSPGFEILVEGPGYRGFAVVDSLVEGRSSGGVRITSDLEVEEVRALAREMSHKYALFLLPRGGAKAGLCLDDSLTGEERARALVDFGRKLGPIVRAGIYYPGMDMNCGPEELRAIYRGVGHELGAAVTDTSWYTAMTVQHALEATVSALGLDGRPLRLAVEGFGRVARHLATRLDPERYRVVGLATVEGGRLNEEGYDLNSLVDAKDNHGDRLVRHLDGEAVDPVEVLAAPADVVLPSSRTWVLHRGIASRIRARAVVPISNAPYADGAVEVLHEKGCTILPGFLSNVGGVLASSLHDLGIADAEIEELLREGYRPVVDALLERALEGKTPLTAFSEAVAREHARHRSPYAEPRSLMQKIGERLRPESTKRSERARHAREDFRARSRQLLDELRRPEFPQ